MNAHRAWSIGTIASGYFGPWEGRCGCGYRSGAFTRYAEAVEAMKTHQSWAERREELAS